MALPFLDCMVPALPRSIDASESMSARFAFIFVPNGMKMDEWTPRRRGRNFDLPFILEPINKVRKSVSVLSGLAIDGGRPHGDGPGDHARAAGSFLTCAHPKKTGGADIFAGVSVDQKLAQALKQNTRLASMELGLEGGRRAGICDSGYSCAYSNNIAWRSPTTPVAKETRPEDVFTRLFGDPNDARDASAKEKRRLLHRSVLDLISADARDLRRKLGRADRAKLDEYMDAVRDLERQLTRPSSAQSPIAGAESVLERGGDRMARMGQMFELMALAFQADQTRVISFMLGNAGSNVAHRSLDIPDGHHDLSHHGNNPAKLAKLRQINRLYVKHLATFLERLQGIEVAGGNLLESSAIVFAAGISDGDHHNHDHLPALLCGHGAGKLHPGTHRKYQRNTPMANLYLSLLKNAGHPESIFADSQGTLTGI